MTSYTKPVVLITGVSGLIGAAIAKEIADDYAVVGLDVVDPEIGEVDWLKCDLTSDQDVQDTLVQVRERYGPELASVVHLAAYYDFSGEPSPLYRDLTVEGTRRLIRSLADLRVEQFVFSSSMLVMKPVKEGEVITEFSALRPEWEYPESKLEAEQVIRKEAKDVKTVTLRIAGVYNEDCNSVPIAQQIRRIYEKNLESYFFPGNTEHGQSFIHLSDLVNCFERVIQKRKSLPAAEVFLIGEPEVMSYGELQNRLGELIHGEKWSTIPIPKTVAKAGAWVKEHLGDEEEQFIKPWMVDMADAHYPVSIERARNQLGWEPSNSLRSTLPEMVSRLKRDPEQWYKMNKLPMPDDLGGSETNLRAKNDE